jgi:two-component system, sensor histidine kinase and response regulator
MPHRIRILFVDDEENNLVSFNAFFRREYEVYTAPNAAAALKILDKVPADIIIADQRMPATTGIEFLEKTLQKHPESIRVLITGQADINVVIDAINKGQVTKYVKKPWEWPILKLVIDNCSELYYSRVEMQNKNKELMKLNDELNRFVYSISHDLRSPLMSILGLIKVSTLEENINAGDHLKRIETSVLKLDSYIRNIIDYYQNAKADHMAEALNFDTIVNEIIESLKSQDQNILFETNIAQKGEFYGDHFRVKVIIANLLSNAIKYQNPEAKENKVSIKISADKNGAAISISDNGVGILQEHIDNIFKMFFRAENSVTQPGTGIGLYIVKEALEKIGGSIKVNSVPLVGSSFEIFIPNQKPKG